MSDEQFDFDPARLIRTMAKNGHNLHIGTQYHAHGDGWCELALPYSEALVTDTASGILASGPIFTLMDMATSLSIWLKTGTFQPQATLDLRIDYLRPAKPGQTVIGHGECYHVTRSIAFIRGHAHDGDPDKPIAHVAGTYFFHGKRMTPIFSPYAQTMGFTSERDSDGRLVISMPFGDGVRGRPGFVHGGALAGLLETIAYVTLADALGDDDKPMLKPVNMTATYMRGAVEATTHARATIERLGKRIANIEAVAWQEDPEKPVAIAQINVMLDRSGR